MVESGEFMFIGEYQHSIDNKNRLILPARFRKGLGPSFVITKGMDNSLFVYPQEEWASIEKKLRALSFTKKDARAFVRMFFSGATECQLDKQGRITLPSNLIKHAEIIKDTVVIGVSSRLEIWSKEGWQDYMQSEDMDYDKLSEKMSELDLEI